MSRHTHTLSDPSLKGLNSSGLRASGSLRFDYAQVRMTSKDMTATALRLGDGLLPTLRKVAKDGAPERWFVGTIYGWAKKPLRDCTVSLLFFVFNSSL